MLHFDVKFYSDDHKKLLRNNPHFKDFERLSADGFDGEEDAFTLNALLNEKKDHDGFRNIRELKAKLPNRLEKLREYYDLSGGTVRARFQPNDMDGMAEAVGAASGLTAMNNAISLIEADWDKISISTTADLDFSIASDGERYYELETKGSVSKETVQLVTPAVSHHLKDIDKKKATQRSKNNANWLIGIITSFPLTENERALCRVTDPPALDGPMDPYKFKLLTRLSFWQRHFSLIARMRLLIALQNRINDILASDDYRALEGRPLVNERNEPYVIPPSLYKGVRTQLMGGKVVGHVFPMNSKEFLFFGGEISVLSVMLEGNFQAITTFRSQLAGTHAITNEECQVEAAELERAGVEGVIEPDAEGSRRPRIKLSGSISIDESGRVFGTLRVDWSANPRLRSGFVP